MLTRPRRNRRTEALRALVRETRLSVDDLIYPMFVCEGKGQRVPIASMPRQYRLSLDELLKEIGDCRNLGIQAIALFAALPDSKKDSLATESINEDGLYLTAIREIKRTFPQLVVMTDVAMDPYSSDGHDGLVKDGQIDNDGSLPILAAMAVAQAEAGADLVGPSDMMDGRVEYIREALDEAGYENVGILSYSAKYASALYGPFRDALDSAPKFGDKKTYQMDPANAREALTELMLDESEGADMVMVKPAGMYLDIISLLRDNTTLPVAAYQVSGEYAMIHAAAEKGWLDLEKTMMESVVAIKRAGADLILTYFAKDLAKLL